jgi:hypothetical protein
MLAAEMHDMWHSWHTGLVLEIIMHLDYIYTLMKSDWDADAASASSMVVVEGLCQLADQANRMGWPTWSVKPKCHMMEEMFQYQAYECGNPDDYN